MNVIGLGGLASSGAWLATGIGALPVFFYGSASPKLLDSLLGFSAGIMLGATSFSLVLPSIQLGGLWVASFGIILGGAFLGVSNRLIPHIHTFSGPEGFPSSFSRVWLFVFAITIHNLPEGLSVGLAFGRGEVGEGLGLAMGIGFQNMPEGMAVAFALLRERYSPFRAFGYATLSGLVEPIGGLLGVSIVTLAQSLLPWGLAFAGGAMLFVISNDIIPEPHRGGHPLEATSGVLLGFVVMTLFDNLFSSI